jgi:large subunit ribosomal protein L4
MEHTLYNTQGKKTGIIQLPESVFNVAWNNDLVHQVVVAMQANARTPIAHTKDRSEVRGTGKKPWKQKGTGNARHGSRRSPIWRTGGVAHGPRNERDYSQKINKKMRNKALASVLSKKLADGEILFLDTLALDAPKTAEGKKVLEALAGVQGFENMVSKKKNSALIAQVEWDDATAKSFRNFGNVTLEEVRNLNPVTILQHKYLVIVPGEASVQTLQQRVDGNVTHK